MFFPVICTSHNAACLPCACFTTWRRNILSCTCLSFSWARRNTTSRWRRAVPTCPGVFLHVLVCHCHDLARHVFHKSGLALVDTRGLVGEFEFEQKLYIEIEEAGRVLRLRIGLTWCRHDGTSPAHLGRPGKRGLHRIYDNIPACSISLLN